MIAITEADEFTASVPVANNAEQCSHGERLATAQALANRLRHHQNSLTGGGVGTTSSIQPTLSDAANGVLVVPAAGRADLLRNALTTLNNKITWLRQYVFGTHVGGASGITWTPTLIAYPAGEWTNSVYVTAGILAPYARQATKGANYAAFRVPELPPGLLISQLVVRVQSPVSHGGTIAGMVMPRIALVAVNSSGVASEIAGQLDTSADPTAYQAVHDITANFSYTTVANTALQLHVRGESGSNSVDDSFRVFVAKLTVWFPP